MNFAVSGGELSVSDTLSLCALTFQVYTIGQGVDAEHRSLSLPALL